MFYVYVEDYSFHLFTTQWLPVALIQIYNFKCLSLNFPLFLCQHGFNYSKTKRRIHIIYRNLFLIVQERYTRYVTMIKVIEHSLSLEKLSSIYPE